MNSLVNNFKKDLLELMEKHGIDSISFNFGECSDLAGIYDEKIAFEDSKGNEVFSVEGYYLGKEDLK